MRKLEPSKAPVIGAEDEVPWWLTVIGENEITEVSETMAKKSFNMGAVTAEMEAEIVKHLDVPYALCTTSGSMALMMALIAGDIGPGDEVIIPTRTFIATAHAASLLGAKVALVDCLKESTAIDIDQVAAKITPRTKAVMPAHLNGRGCDMTALNALVKEHGMIVIEDACQAMFSRGPDGYHGTVGDFGCFSFGMAKLVSTGQGGAIVTRDKEMYEKLSIIRNHGIADVVSHAYMMPAHNFKYNDIQASIGLWQVRRGPEKVAHVNAIYKRYQEGLEGLSFIDLIPVDIDKGETALQAEVMSEERDALMAFLAWEGVQTRKLTPCVHTAPHFNNDEAFPNSERFNRLGFKLPSGPNLPLDCVDRTIVALKKYAQA